MDVRYINPLVEATGRVFRTMLKIDVEIGKPALSESLVRYDVSGIIGLSGDVTGSVVLSLPTPVARQVVGRFAGTELPADHPDFADAIGELVNMISGAAKASFDGLSVSISCPSVVFGAAHRIARPSDSVCVAIPCRIYCGDFSINFAIRGGRAPSSEAATSQTRLQTH